MTAQALTFHLNNEAEETATFVEYFDKFFDMLNITNIYQMLHKEESLPSTIRWRNYARLESFLSKRVLKDLLEKYLGRQRQRQAGLVNGNPTCSQFIKNNEALRVVTSIKIYFSIISEALIDSGFNIPLAEAFAARDTTEKIKERLLNPQRKQAIQPYEMFLLQMFDQ
uniref:Uncharacterized protein n=1 Tax=Amphimedon queenslandica TaxID=400682 RepID=A0A1X7V759_AMPQE